MISEIYNTSSPFLSSIAADSAAIAFTDIKWPNNPFHKGEIALQQAAGVQEHVMSYAPEFVRNYMPDQHRAFYAELPFLVGAARDETGAMWSTLLEKPFSEDKDARFVSSPRRTVLNINAQPVHGDALHNAFSSQTKTDLGLLGIQLETKRRNRVNGRVTADVNSGGMIFTVDQSFGNCPQYIKPRANWYREVREELAAATPLTETQNTAKRFAKHLTLNQIERIQSAETIFTASGYRGRGEDVRFGNDASHRGGPPGFVRVIETETSSGKQQTITWTEYPGNNHFNTLGNIVMDPRVGISIPDFDTGALLQVSGTAAVEMGKLEDGGRKVHMLVTAVNEMPAGSLPIRWATEDNAQQPEKYQALVSRIVRESENVKSFYLEPADPFNTFPGFRAGQHLPLELTLDDGQVVKRTYSLSAAPKGTGFYRISVKKHPKGAASMFLHNRIKVGHELTIGLPAGDFVRVADHARSRTTVLLSSGIGVTPMLSMLHEMVAEHQAVNSKNNGSRISSGKSKIVWIHGARNGRYHPFREEVDALIEKSHRPTERRIFYSQPDPIADARTAYTKGRISVQEVRKVVPEWKEAIYYMCGPPAFLADMQSGLERIGVDPNRIYFETF